MVLFQITFQKYSAMNIKIKFCEEIFNVFHSYIYHNTVLYADNWHLSSPGFKFGTISFFNLLLKRWVFGWFKPFYGHLMSSMNSSQPNWETAELYQAGYTLDCLVMNFPLNRYALQFLWGSWIFMTFSWKPEAPLTPSNYAAPVTQVTLAPRTTHHPVSTVQRGLLSALPRIKLHLLKSFCTQISFSVSMASGFSTVLTSYCIW